MIATNEEGARQGALGQHTLRPDHSTLLRSDFVAQVRAAVLGRWAQTLADVGIDSQFLRNKHGPCPGCGGRDRFRFDDKDGNGTFICSGGGGDTLSGDGFKLVMHVLGCNFKAAVRLLGNALAIQPQGWAWANGRASEARGITGTMDASLENPSTAEDLRRSVARQRAASIWTSARPCTGHPYLARKGIQPHGTRRKGELLILPVRDATGVIQTLQFITPTAVKTFLKYGRVRGCYFAIGEVTSNVLLIAEGFATAATLHEATGCATAVAFNAHNLRPVAETLRRKLPSVRIVVCADNDADTIDNPGLKGARDAVRSVEGTMAAPTFRCGDDGTDWNDYATRYGIAALRVALAPIINNWRASE